MLGHVLAGDSGVELCKAAVAWEFVDYIDDCAADIVMVTLIHEQILLGWVLALYNVMMLLAYSGVCVTQEGVSVGGDVVFIGVCIIVV
eukprot:4518636-Ditylum_brightwellii.AAC.1